ncbi:MAG: SDR family NAD(P)-dependent oxidoreductase [Chitinophagaceae bacterium]
MSTVLITGASSGIGLELAKVFAQQKHSIILVARSKSKLEALAEVLRQTGVEVHLLVKDLSSNQSAVEVFDWCNQHGVVVDYLVNNAGFGDFGFFHESNWTKQEQMINLNITTLTQLTHLFLPQMVKRKSGKIMNVASTAAFQPGPTMSVYYATKAYVLHFTEAISNELKGTGVTVTALCPGATESGFQLAAAMEESKLVKGKNLPSSMDVAVYGYKAMMNGKTVAVHGFMNSIMATGYRFLPRKWIVQVTRMIQDKK